MCSCTHIYADYILYIILPRLIPAQYTSTITIPRIWTQESMGCWMNSKSKVTKAMWKNGGKESIYFYQFKIIGNYNIKCHHIKAGTTYPSQARLWLLCPRLESTKISTVMLETAMANHILGPVCPSTCRRTKKKMREKM